MPQPRFARTIITVIAVLALLSGCSTAGSPSTSSGPASAAPAAEVSPFHKDRFYAATATRAQLAVHESPDGPISTRLDHPIPSGAPLTFLIKGHEDDWLEVYLPMRPNEVTGWISDRGVEIHELTYNIEVSVADKKLELYEHGSLVQTYPVATGTGGTPTPLGSFYLTELMAPTNVGYGPYAFGLSGFSEVLSEFGGGPGQIGLHGTDDESSIGQAASHGCIRLANADITALAELLPLGTPIEIR